MKIKIMTSKALAYVKNNINELKHHYLNRENPQVWLKEALKEEAFVDTDLFANLEDFNLELEKAKPASTDVDNIKKIYSNFIELNDSFASDERLWAGLSHTIFYDYVLDRFPLVGKNIGNDILNHFFFRIRKPRCYMVNTLSRLWWIGRLTYCTERENKFELLDYISHDINGYAFTLYGSNWSNNKDTLNSFFNSIFAFEKDHNTTVKRELFEETGISRKDIELDYFMDINYFKYKNNIQVFYGILKHEVNLVEEKNKLEWVFINDELLLEDKSPEL